MCSGMKVVVMKMVEEETCNYNMMDEGISLVGEVKCSGMEEEEISLEEVEMYSGMEVVVMEMVEEETCNSMVDEGISLVVEEICSGIVDEGISLVVEEMCNDMMVEGIFLEEVEMCRELVKVVMKMEVVEIYNNMGEKISTKEEMIYRNKAHKPPHWWLQGKLL